MKIGFHVVDFSWTRDSIEYGPSLTKAAQIAEQSGVTQLTFMDHYFQMEMMAPYTDPMMEGYTSIAYLANVTTKLNLGLLVTGVTYRHPGLLAKIVTTLDILSGGRALLGIGAAWYEREHLGLGVPFPVLKQRFEMLEETLQICLQMWSDNDGAFDGSHYKLSETICHPAPITTPHPRILIGGSGEKKTLKLVAKYADACNIFGTSLEEVEAKLNILKNHCINVGRNYDDIEKTVSLMGTNPLLDPEHFLQQLEDYKNIGIEMVIIRLHGNPAEFAARFTDLLADKVLSI